MGPSKGGDPSLLKRPLFHNEKERGIQKKRDWVIAHRRSKKYSAFKALAISKKRKFHSTGRRGKSSLRGGGGERKKNRTISSEQRGSSSSP